MKRLLSITLSAMILSSPLQAQSLNDVEVAESKLRIKDIKELVGTQINKGETCLDEYLARRKELSQKLWLTPVTGVLEVGGGTAGGLALGALAGNIFNIQGWNALGALLAGGFVGMAAGVSVFITGSTVNIVKFANNDRIIKWIAEARLNESNHASAKMLKKYNKKFTHDNATQEDIQALIVKMDQSGELCNGSIVAPSRLKKGKKLKQRLANKAEIFKKIHEVISR